PNPPSAQRWDEATGRRQRLDQSGRAHPLAQASHRFEIVTVPEDHVLARASQILCDCEVEVLVEEPEVARYGERQQETSDRPRAEPEGPAARTRADRSGAREKGSARPRGPGTPGRCEGGSIGRGRKGVRWPRRSPPAAARYGAAAVGSGPSRADTRPRPPQR